jgi:hypothetical protein
MKKTKLIERVEQREFNGGKQHKITVDYQKSK